MSVSIASPASVAPAPPRFAFAGLVASNILLAFGPMMVRMADVGPVAGAFWRLGLALPLLLLLTRVKRQSLRGLSPMLWGMVMLGGVFFAADLASWHLGIMRTKIANATLFGNVSSLLLPICSMVALRQLPGRTQSAALLLAAAGTAMLMGTSYEASSRYLAGDLLCILAGVFYTGYILFMQRARERLGSWAVLAVSSATGALPLLLAAMAMGEKIIPGNWTGVVLLALSSQVVGQGLLIYSLAWFSPLVIGLTLLLQPVIGALVGWTIFGETLSATDAMGAVAIAGALILVRLPARA